MYTQQAECYQAPQHLRKLESKTFYFHKPLWCEVMLKTRVRLPALTYGINKLITLANIRKYRNIMYGYSHDEAEKATSALNIRKVITSERVTRMIPLPRWGREYKPTILRRQKQTLQENRCTESQISWQNNWARLRNPDDSLAISLHVRVSKKKQIQTVQSWLIVYFLELFTKYSCNALTYRMQICLCVYINSSKVHNILVFRYISYMYTRTPTTFKKIHNVLVHN